MVGPSTHSGEPHTDRDLNDLHDHHDPSPIKGDDRGSTARTDPVCGMSVEREVALAKGLHSRHHGQDYFFCGKGCKLDFGDEPVRYLDPSYVASM